MPELVNFWLTEKAIRRDLKAYIGGNIHRLLGIISKTSVS